MNLLEGWAEHKIELIILAIGVVVLIALIIAIAVLKHKNNILFKFRRYGKFEGPPENRELHPKLIVEETDEEYGFMGLTESRKHGNSNNLPIQNPQKGNTRESYIRKEVRHDSKDNFLEILKDYKLTRKDKKRIIRYLENRKKK